ncbi:hypothetical protein EDC63_112109 [Sulfurirhabdus autotrophica]|uniref:Uncharacterized protein n=1 Tax=Sulfurirhabdus autotrophica TaxID=1706046 RepID=A0A4R3Y253_9PROT|nr:hypothetical protein EDC63_112109 [Sulfurirhabdus autotrophica]
MQKALKFITNGIVISEVLFLLVPLTLGLLILLFIGGGFKDEVQF